MLAIQQIACLRMVESRCRRIPVHDREALPVVVGVALHARRARTAALRKGRVQPAMLLQFGSDLLVALETEK
jgi:hypothetical protein